MSVTHTVLIVDDNLELAENLREILEDEGHAAEIAGSGAEALVRLASGAPVDLILTDLRMPGMNGVEMMRAVKARWPQTPVVVMTAFSRDALLDEAEAGGALEVLSKPVDLGALTTFVARVVAAEAPVLLVEDDAVLRAELTSALQTLEVVPHPAPDLATARRLLETVSFKAAVVDLRLPDGDGLAVGEALRAHPGGPVPVIYITGYRPDFDVALGPGHEARVSPILEKPFPPGALLGLVERVL